MRVKTLEVAGIGPALHAMRNPMDSWDRSDTVHGQTGPKDMELSNKLASAGPEHAKHLRLIQVWAEVWAPRYWWMEFDTYRAGVEKLSCSTMHKLTGRDITVSDFALDEDGKDPEGLQATVDTLNGYLHNYVAYKGIGDFDTAGKWWRRLIQALPQGYIQRRTVMTSYAALRNIYNQRRGHKLREWLEFRQWIETLPESWMITGKLPDRTQSAVEDD